MLLNIVFSYNRAMQLDYLLNTIVKRLDEIDFETVVLYHTTGKHNEGYEKLKQQYKNEPKIKFLKRKKFLFDPALLKFVREKKNYHFFLEKSLKNKKSDLFKSQLETLLRKSKHNFTMFNTDDGVFFKDFNLDIEILKAFKDNPTETSYRTYLGDNIEGFPSFVKRKGSHYEWDYYAEKKITHWTYPFSVDGTVYDTKNLLGILTKFVYHNPITLEENGVRYVMKNKLLKNGLSPIHSKLRGTIINRVSIDSHNPTIDISVDFLNEKFLEGFRLDLILNHSLKDVNMIPLEVALCRDTEKIVIYKMNDEGKEIQNRYGPEGSIKE